MAGEVEIAELDVRYEEYRLKDPGREAKLLLSIQERGIEEPIEGVEVRGARILLNGFKRYRCARRLGLGVVPWSSLGEDEATGIIAVMRTANDRALSILEQARFIDELFRRHGLSPAALAETLSRSKAWVSMRLGLIAEMSEKVRRRVFSGAFPVYSYMYAVRPFMRMNGVARQEAEGFVEAVSGKKLSVREIGQLAQGYFKGPERLREEIRSGKLALALERMQRVTVPSDGCSEFERVLLRDLEILQKYMQRVLGKSLETRAWTQAFRAQAGLLLAGILSRIETVTQALRTLHARSGEA
ncbi:MAG: ParB N-terminal domain-containing protein [Candidatus Wallbacteria bacterium]|nr:ParB N-terminal domain-containing protein [Candidatus Wallbacteria bacterium]